MVSIVLLFLTLLIVQAVLYLYVRNVVTASAAEGARYAASADSSPDDGARVATDLIARGASRAVADRVGCVGREQPGAGSETLIEVQCSGKVPALFLPGSGVLPIDVRGRAIKESS